MCEGLAQWIEAAGVVAAAVGAWRQIGELKRQERGWNTLEICQKYDFDPVLDKTLDALRAARNSGNLTKDPAKYHYEITTILNYFDGIAIGQEQLFYDSIVVREHMEPIIRGTLEEFFEPTFVQQAGIDTKDYLRLTRLIEKWNRPSYVFSRRGGSPNDGR